MSANPPPSSVRAPAIELGSISGTPGGEASGVKKFPGSRLVPKVNSASPLAAVPEGTKSVEVPDPKAAKPNGEFVGQGPG